MGNAIIISTPCPRRRPLGVLSAARAERFQAGETSRRLRWSTGASMNATQIDFVRNDGEFDDLVSEIFRPDKAPVEYYNPAILKR